MHPGRELAVHFEFVAVTTCFPELLVQWSSGVGAAAACMHAEVQAYIWSGHWFNPDDGFVVVSEVG